LLVIVDNNDISNTQSRCEYCYVIFAGRLVLLSRSDLSRSSIV